MRARILMALALGCAPEGDGPSHIDYSCEAVSCPTADATNTWTGPPDGVECLWLCPDGASVETLVVWERDLGCYQMTEVVTEPCP